MFNELYSHCVLQVEEMPQALELVQQEAYLQEEEAEFHC